jgi:hypothetical protein
MCSRFAHSETTVDRQTVFPLLCVGLLVEVILKLPTMPTSNLWKVSKLFIHTCFTANISFVLLPIFVLLFKLIKSRFVIYILFTLFRIQSLSPSLLSHRRRAVTNSDAEKVTIR